MTKTEIKEALVARHAEEINDDNGYDTLADELCKEGFPQYAGILRDIAREEETHAKLLKEIIDSM